MAMLGLVLTCSRQPTDCKICAQSLHHSGTGIETTPNDLAMSSKVRVAVYIQPRAKRTEVAGRHGPDLKIRVAAPPIDQAANEALLAFIARRLGLRKRDVRLIAGATSRRKVLEVEGITADQVQVLLT